MNTTPQKIPQAKKTTGDLTLAFDVGHSSIGWAVLQRRIDQAHPDILGCGSVVFRADDCLASTRRTFRRQRRHIRSTRQRISRMKRLLANLGVLTTEQLDKPGCAWPWKLAARVLAHGKLLSWPELWDVLRWYAHNRGYDANRRWSALESETEKEDTEKLQNAQSLMEKHGARSMAATLCRELGVDPLSSKNSSHVRFKGLNAAFPREIAESEVQEILHSHFGKLPKCDAALEKALLDDWRGIPCDEIKLPNRYEGGLLFGQLVPRFDNRIIAVCPISGDKVPSRNTREFLDFRWAMTLANVRVGARDDRELRPLNARERSEIDKRIRQHGYFTPGELKRAVREVAKTERERDNLDTMLMHPDAKDALLVDPVKKVITSEKLAPFRKLLPMRLEKRVVGQLRRGKAIRLGHLRAQLQQIGESTEKFDAEVQLQLDAQNIKARRKQKQIASEDLLDEKFAAQRLDGRAAYSRDILKQAVAEVMAGKHPKEKGGCLFRSEEIRDAHVNREIAQQTNNHLVRHRLLILQRLLRDVIAEFAGGDKKRVGRVTIEVNRELREMSGKTNKEIAQDLGLRLANFKSVVRKLEADESFMRQLRGRALHRIPPGLIRKARIAEDLGWKCPYTGQSYEAIDLLTRRVDKDHIVPRSDRTSDALDSLVITFSAINKWKGKRTALKFVEDEQGKPVPNLPNLTIVALAGYREFVDALQPKRDPRKLKRLTGHARPIDDDLRRWKRKELLMLRDYEEKEFTPRDLTQTSQLVRLGALAIRKEFLVEKNQPVITSLPGFVTGTLRKGWNRNLLGCLSTACSQVLDENGEIRTKTDIRDITHLHHALDAIVLGLSDHYIPNNGRVWELIGKRKLDDTEKLQLRALGIFDFSPEGFRLKALPAEIDAQVRQRLAEKRVVQHVPARMDGLRVEQNIWRVVESENGESKLRQRIRQPDGKRVAKETSEKNTKLLGLFPLNSSGKLKQLKGALVIPDNFGIALDPQPTIIPFHKVWTRFQTLKQANGGKMPRILRNGQIIRIAEGTYKGTWMLRSIIANPKKGVLVGMSWPDVINYKQTGHSGAKDNVQFSSLLDGKLEIVKTPLTGVPCPST